MTEELTRWKTLEARLLHFYALCSVVECKGRTAQSHSRLDEAYAEVN
jgi:hypothetical protein